MVTISDLPAEIIFSIMEDENINMEDIENFSLTCKKFKTLINQDFWKKVFARRWPSAKIACKSEIGIEFNKANIRDLKKSAECAKQLQSFISDMSKRYYPCEMDYHIIENINKFLYFHRNYPLNSYILFDELVRRIYKDARKSKLIERCYMIKMFQYLHRYLFTVKWQKYEENYLQKQRLENKIVMILQWCHSDKFITQSDFEKFINDIVKTVMQSLKFEDPHHPLFAISRKQFKMWKRNYIENNYWCEKDAKTIKTELDKVVEKLDLCDSWMEPNQVDITFAHSSPTKKEKLQYRHMLLIAIYICAAKRLGLYVVTLLQEPQHSALDVHLIWKSSPENAECFTFDWKDDQDNIKISGIKKYQSQDRYSDFMSSGCASTMEIIESFDKFVLDPSPF